MNSRVQWDRVENCTLWTLPRIARADRAVLGELAVDMHLLRRCAEDQQILFVDRCGPRLASTMICDAAQRLSHGMIWTITAGDASYKAMMEEVSNLGQGDGGTRGVAVYDIHPAFKNAKTWQRDGFKVLITATESLRDHSKYNMRRRRDTTDLFFPLISIIDPDLSLMQKRKGFDPAWVIRDIVAKTQGCMCVVVFTERDAVSAFVSNMLASFCAEGVLYLTSGGQRWKHAEGAIEL